MRLILVLALLTATSAAHAQGNTRWRDIGKTSSGNTVFVDTRSIKDAIGMKVAVVRTVYAEAVSTPQGPITGSRARAMQTGRPLKLSNYQCQTRSCLRAKCCLHPMPIF